MYVISASPYILTPIIAATMKAYDMDYDKIFTRHFWEIGSEEKKIKYKISHIESVIRENPNDSLILLGDNVEADHKVYLEVAKRNPNKVDKIYIRKVKNEDVPASVIGFYSAFEIAGQEYEEKRLNLAQVEDIANSILTTKDCFMYQVIPKYAYCPTEKKQFSLVSSPELKDLENQVINKIITSCKKRLK